MGEEIWGLIKRSETLIKSEVVKTVLVAAKFNCGMIRIKDSVRFLNLTSCQPSHCGIKLDPPLRKKIKKGKVRKQLAQNALTMLKFNLL